MFPGRVAAPRPARPHVAPPPLFGTAEQIAAAASAPRVDPPAPRRAGPPPPPVDLAALRAALQIEGELSLPRAASVLGALPGLLGCVLTLRDQSGESGELPAGMNPEALRACLPRIAGVIKGESAVLGEVQHLTLYGEHRCTSVFGSGAASVAVFHRTSVLLPGVREKLAAAVQALGRA